MRVGDRGFEPLTSSVSRKRSPPELIALAGIQLIVVVGSAVLPSQSPERTRGGGGNRTRVQGFAGPCLRHSATPPSPDGRRRCPGGAPPVRGRSRADDGIRTRDPHLGKVMLYQLSHVRARGARPPCCQRTLSERDTSLQTSTPAGTIATCRHLRPTRAG